MRAEYSDSDQTNTRCGKHSFPSLRSPVPSILRPTLHRCSNTCDTTLETFWHNRNTFCSLCTAQKKGSGKKIEHRESFYYDVIIVWFCRFYLCSKLSERVSGASCIQMVHMSISFSVSHFFDSATAVAAISGIYHSFYSQYTHLVIVNRYHTIHNVYVVFELFSGIFCYCFAYDIT